MAQYRHPWNFGITPSQYIRSKGKPGEYVEEAVTALGRGRYDEGLGMLDDLYMLTLKCPPLRKISPQLGATIESLGTKDARLAASYARPGCYFFSLDKKKAKEFFASMKVCGFGELHLTELDNSFDASTGDPIVDNMGTLNMSFSERINDECVSITKATNSNSAPVSAYHLVMGIAFGFPVGDVIEASSGSPQMLFEDAVLSHFITPLNWSKLWAEKVGFDGENKLARLYKRVLGINTQK